MTRVYGEYRCIPKTFYPKKKKTDGSLLTKQSSINASSTRTELEIVQIAYGNSLWLVRNLSGIQNVNKRIFLLCRPDYAPLRVRVLRKCCCVETTIKYRNGLVARSAERLAPIAPSFHLRLNTCFADLNISSSYVKNGEDLLSICRANSADDNNNQSS